MTDAPIRMSQTPAAKMIFVLLTGKYQKRKESDKCHHFIMLQLRCVILSYLRFLIALPKTITKVTNTIKLAKQQLVPEPVSVSFSDGILGGET